MSDQVEIVAAEDAPSNMENGETEVSAQNASQEPEATAAESDVVAVPTAEATAAESDVEVTSTAEATAESAPAAEETQEEPLVDGPVGEVLDDNAQADAAQTENAQAEAVQAEAAQAENAQADAAQAEAVQADNAQADAEEGTESADAEGGKGNVRILSVGQQVTGTIKRIADFGAFVDIGVGRDGLIHISELSVRRVGKVTDVLNEGQEVTAWIKKLDRDRNRISLTLIDPNTKTIRDLNKDDIVQGTVTRILPYGAFVDIGIGRDALLHVREMGVGYVAKPEDVVKVGDTIEARIIELSRRRGRVDLSLKGLREEPEPAPQAQMPTPQAPQQERSHSRRQAEPEPEEEEDFEDLEVLSPMELAFKRAMEAEGMEMPVSRKKQGKRNRREGNRSLQDEIISRTLSSGRK